jgi:hypothetical protein
MLLVEWRAPNRCFQWLGQAPEAPKARWRVDRMGQPAPLFFSWAAQGPRDRYLHVSFSGGLYRK